MGCDLGIRVWGVGWLSWDSGHSPVVTTGVEYAWPIVSGQHIFKNFKSYLC